ncbi:MAG: hypothetical protein FWB85_01255 [Chitinispirillia bacterium]|nr:hypothetical protein [Chitinispirillia bacterium]MCL2241286.1 hypothetical protein [Chitinispirillia bacterium]
MPFSFDLQLWPKYLTENVAPIYVEEAGKDLVFIKKEAIGRVTQSFPSRMKWAWEASRVHQAYAGYVKLALYIQLHLENPLFDFYVSKSDQRLSQNAQKINEHYCFDIMCMVLQEQLKRPLNEAIFEPNKGMFLLALTHMMKNSDRYKQYPKSTARFANIIYEIGQMCFK